MTDPLTDFELEMLYRCTLRHKQREFEPREQDKPRGTSIPDPDG